MAGPAVDALNALGLNVSGDDGGNHWNSNRHGNAWFITSSEPAVTSFAWAGNGQAEMLNSNQALTDIEFYNPLLLGGACRLPTLDLGRVGTATLTDCG